MLEGVSKTVGALGFASYKQRATTLFAHTASVLLFCTAAAKLISSLGNAPILKLHDPLLVIPFRWVFVVVANIEIGVGLFCLLHKSRVAQAGLLAWLSFSFILYRLGLHLIGYGKPCPCLGTLTGAIHVSPETADIVMKIVLGYFLIGSLAILLTRDKN